MPLKAVGGRYSITDRSVFGVELRQAIRFAHEVVFDSKAPGVCRHRQLRLSG